jgi:hypothetical protein
MSEERGQPERVVTRPAARLSGGECPGTIGRMEIDAASYPVQRASLDKAADPVGRCPGRGQPGGGNDSRKR